jgi:hypothetical protein
MTLRSENAYGPAAGPHGKGRVLTLLDMHHQATGPAVVAGQRLTGFVPSDGRGQCHCKDGAYLGSHKRQP